MGLLDQLRADDSSSHQTNQKWADLPDRLGAALKNYKHGKTVLIRGEVIVIGRCDWDSSPRYLYFVLHSEKTASDPANSKTFSHHAELGARPPGARPIAMGLSRYRADSEANLYADPWVDWVTPEPDDVVRWVARIISTSVMDTPAMERRRIARMKEF